HFERDYPFTLTIGRSKSALLHLNDLEISREHAELVMGEQGLAIRDIGSTHGTYDNGQRIATSKLMYLHQGDVVRLAFDSYRVTETPDGISLTAQDTAPTLQPANPSAIFSAFLEARAQQCKNWLAEQKQSISPAGRFERLNEEGYFVPV